MKPLYHLLAPVRAGQLDDGIRAMRAALDQLPADRVGPLWLYLARVRNGVPGLGKRELEDSLALQGKEDWPRTATRQTPTRSRRPPATIAPPRHPPQRTRTL
jgi:hypothetical protein